MEQNKILQIIPAPNGLRAAFRIDEPDSQEFNFMYEPVAALALMENAEGTRFVQVLVSDDWCGLRTPVEADNFAGIEWGGEHLDPTREQ